MRPTVHLEADALLSGALSSWDAEAFHDALWHIVAATLLTIGIYLAHQVGRSNLTAAFHPLAKPPTSAEPYSVAARTAMW
jgi:hypothetical protein